MLVEREFLSNANTDAWIRSFTEKYPLQAWRKFVFAYRCRPSFSYSTRERERERERTRKRERERERGWLCRRMFFGHWEYTDGFKAGGFSFASDQSSLAVIRNFFFSLPSTAMPREPYAKIRERKRGRKGKRKVEGKGRSWSHEPFLFLDRQVIQMR